MTAGLDGLIATRKIVPKYRDKMRLRRWIARHGRVDDFTRWLILQGYDDEVVQAGLDHFVGAWEEAVRNEVLHPSTCLEEWQLCAWTRELLADAIAHAPDDEVRALADRIGKADEAFCELSAEAPPQDGTLSDSPWWWNRWPRNGFP